jgi:hypothetical protein
MGGRVNISVQISITQIPHINAGKVRPLAIFERDVFYAR